MNDDKMRELFAGMRREDAQRAPSFQALVTARTAPAPAPASARGRWWGGAAAVLVPAMAVLIFFFMAEPVRHSGTPAPARNHVQFIGTLNEWTAPSDVLLSDSIASSSLNDTAVPTDALLLASVSYSVSER